ncbi:MAG: isocitrate lyase/phosphoenolpyruvate mutase family protein [Actinobacteria bacterium]|nr:isocitrate lyase/phosphoenolpyruvate mutase family protein [Actinomycetota bacterium]
MKSPSNRSLKDSAGEKLLLRLKKIQKPLIAIDAIDAFTLKFQDGYSSFFEGSWMSSLGLSSRHGFSDAYNLSPRDFIVPINDIKMASDRGFIIVDADNGGQSHKNTSYTFKLFASLGVSLAFVENKKGVKFNSVDPCAGKFHTLEDRDIFAKKINAAIASQNSTLVGIRLEDSIVNDDDELESIKAALNAADYFIQKCRPDFFLFHWKKDSPEIPIRFAREYRKLISKYAIKSPPYLACVPTTYSKNISNQKLYKEGYSIIIYGNALLRVQAKAIINALDAIKESDSLKTLEAEMLPTKAILDLMEDRK